jgi:P27 family predicted phage terminase small subunit
MARPRQPISLLEAKGKKHLTKAEKEERQATEVQPCTDDIKAPAYLTAAEKKRFDKLAGQLQKIKIMGETDVETLARYVTAQGLYEQAVKDLRQVHKERPKNASAGELAAWVDVMSVLDKRQDRYFKQAQTAASKLGLTITDRCKLVAPVKDEKPPENKFAKFGGGKAATGA